MNLLLTFILLGLSSAQLPAPTPVVANCPTATPEPSPGPKQSVPEPGTGFILGRRCGTPEAPQSLMDLIPRLANNSNIGPEQIPPVFNINTYFHVISTNASQNKYDESFYLRQLQVMNDRYSSTNFQFNLAGFDTHVNDTEAVAADDAIEFEIKRKYHNGTYRDLNLYFLSDWAPGGRKLYGRCTYPQPGVITPDIIKQDGCFILQDTLPGGNLAGIDLGYTAVHEIGHWLLLVHPWGPVGEVGDCIRSAGIADLPIQRQALGGCQNGIVTCPGLQVFPFADPIHNFMGYSDDCCMTEFTAGQIAVMRGAYLDMRAGK